MADALVFGRPNDLTGRIADGIADVLRVPVRYQQSLEQLDRPGVALCTTLEALTSDAPLLVFADGQVKDRKAADEERATWLGLAARAAIEGRPIVTVHGKAQANAWLGQFAAEGAPEGQPLRRVYIVGEAGTGGADLAGAVSEVLGLPLTHLDDFVSADPEAGHERWQRQILDAAGNTAGWVMEGAYWRAASMLTASADVSVYLDLAVPTERGTRSFGLRLPVAFRARGSPIFESRLLRHELLQGMPRGPVLRARNDAEVTAIRGALTGGR